MPNRPSSPRDPLRRGGAAGLVDLWTTQRSVAHKLHNASSSSKRKRTNDVLSKPDKSECYRQPDLNRCRKHTSCPVLFPAQEQGR